MKFKIIPNEHTPKIEEYKSIDDLLKEDKKMLEKFISYASIVKNCVGLSSNQISVNGIRIMQPFFVARDCNGWEICIHPKILKKSIKTYKAIELCKTWGHKKIKAKRHHWINIIYYNLNGEAIEKKVEGFKAQIYQHEIDHLLGKKEVFEKVNNERV